MRKIPADKFLAQQVAICRYFVDLLRAGDDLSKFQELSLKQGALLAAEKGLIQTLALACPSVAASSSLPVSLRNLPESERIGVIGEWIGSPDVQMLCGWLETLDYSLSEWRSEQDAQVGGGSPGVIVTDAAQGAPKLHWTLITLADLDRLLTFLQSLSEKLAEQHEY